MFFEKGIHDFVGELLYDYFNSIFSKNCKMRNRHTTATDGAHAASCFRVDEGGGIPSLWMWACSFVIT